MLARGRQSGVDIDHLSSLQGLSLRLYAWFGAEYTLVALALLDGVGALYVLALAWLLRGGRVAGPCDGSGTGFLPFASRPPS